MEVFLFHPMQGKNSKRLALPGFLSKGERGMVANKENRISLVNGFFSFWPFSFRAHRKRGIVHYLSKNVPLRSIPQMVTRSFLQAAVAAAFWQRPLLFFFEQNLVTALSAFEMSMFSTAR